MRDIVRPPRAFRVGWRGRGRVSVESRAKWAGGERHVIEDIEWLRDTSSKTYYGFEAHVRAVVAALAEAFLAIWCPLARVCVPHRPAS